MGVFYWARGSIKDREVSGPVLEIPGGEGQGNGTDVGGVDTA